MPKTNKELAVELTIAIINNFPEALKLSTISEKEVNVDASLILHSMYEVISKLGD